MAGRKRSYITVSRPGKGQIARVSLYAYKGDLYVGGTRRWLAGVVASPSGKPYIRSIPPRVSTVAGGKGVRAMSTTAGSGVEVVAIDTPALGDRSYLAHDREVALVIDPQRDIDRVLALAAARGVRITHVFETHRHNDYVTGGLALARATGAAYHVNG